jgi:hypothetical protein
MQTISQEPILRTILSYPKASQETTLNRCLKTAQSLLPDNTKSCQREIWDTPNVAPGQPHGWPQKRFAGQHEVSPIFSSSLALLAFNLVPSTASSSPIRRVGEWNPNFPWFSFPCHHGGPGTRPVWNEMNAPKAACYKTLAANLLLASAFKVEVLWGTQKGAKVLYPYIVGWCEVHYIPNCLWEKSSWGQRFILPLWYQRFGNFLKK